ncbi:hypothetical protein AXF42_Ash018920 [Apostasia shenzhenica]|uniref:Uncharacterized protein n=1 Tax=Apostasia shenzhenica TaxID=1088818 RepID=A0A2I0B4J1_9ASPA|nr:hypothetical protein AXF42_Ash018920 [Apostasia shenzhenica]
MTQPAVALPPEAAASRGASWPLRTQQPCEAVRAVAVAQCRGAARRRPRLRCATARRAMVAALSEAA